MPEKEHLTKHKTFSFLSFHCKEVVKTITLEQDPPKHKTDGVLCLYLPSSTSKDGVFIA